MMTETLMGYPIHLSPYHTERVQVRFPRSKRKRIRKKWAKRPGNFATRPKSEVCLVDSEPLFGIGQPMKFLVIHPATWATLKRRLASDRPNYDGLADMIFTATAAGRTAPPGHARAAAMHGWPS